MTQLRNILGPIFHVLVLCHHFNVLGYSHVTYTKDLIKDDTDQTIVDMIQFSTLFFTNWNLVIQVLYFVLAVVSDILRIFSLKPQVLDRVVKTKGYLFITFVFPCSLYVAGMFWGLYTIDRELILPKVLDCVVPEWLNHSIHTNIAFFVILEVLVVNQLLPSFRSSLIGLTVLTVIYDTLFFAAYFYYGRWIYALFYVLSWPQRIIIFVFNYLVHIAILKIGIVIENFKYTSVKSKNKLK